MHSYDGKTAIFYFNGGLVHSDLIIYCKETGTEIRIDSDDVINLVREEYEESYDENLKGENNDWISDLRRKI